MVWDMKKFFFLFLCVSLPLVAQSQNNDPYINSTVVVNSIEFKVDRYYPFLGSSEKPFSSELGIRLTDQEGKYTAYLYFRNQIISPTFDLKKNTIRLYFAESYYQILLKRLEESSTTTVNYRQYKDGHSWGDVDFDKYPR
jgi:hypothetical protein